MGGVGSGRYSRKMTNGAKNELIAIAVGSGETQTEVAEKLGLTRQRVSQIVEKVRARGEEIEKYREFRADVKAFEQMKREMLQQEIMGALTAEEIKNASFKDKIVAMNLLGQDKAREFEQERLVRGESTENVSVIVQAIREAKKKRKERLLEGKDAEAG